MSQYVNFYLRAKNEFYPIGTFCRSSTIFHTVSDFMPYEKIRPLSFNAVESFIKMLEDSIAHGEKEKANFTERIENILRMNNSIEDKINELNDIDEIKEEIDDSIKEANMAIGYFSSLLDMIDDAEDTKYYEDKTKCLDADKYIYAGIECGHPTLEDIC